MTITRANAEAVLVRRIGRKMTAAGLDGSTANGTNGDLNDPLATALLDMGLTVQDIANVADADLVAVDNIPELLDRAELRALESVIGNLDAVNISIGPRSESLGQLSDQCEQAVNRLQAKIAAKYGTAASLEGGSLSLDFAEKFDDTVV